MIRTMVACGAVTTLAGVAGLLIREYIVYKGLFRGQKVFEKQAELAWPYSNCLLIHKLN